MQKCSIQFLKEQCFRVGIAAALATGFFSGCSPSLKSTIKPPVIASAEERDDKSSKNQLLKEVQLSVDEINDVRDPKAIAQFKGSLSESEAPLGPIVQGALKDALIRHGVVITDTAPIVISGEIRKWIAVVEGGFPAKVSGDASIHIEVFDPANKRIYAGNYEGFASMEHPSIDEGDIRKTLGAAMSQAINQVILDKQLVNVLASF